ncbi:MAG: AAA family ATPase [Desulfurococcaceae archaeon]
MVKIVISGPPGSGKTTQAKLISEKLNLRLFSAGLVFREIARERGLSVEELSLVAVKDPTIDLEVDRKTFEAAKDDNIVIDGHLAGWIVGDMVDYRIYITAPLILRVLRIASRDGVSIESALKETLIRETTQRKRFFEIYGIDTSDLSTYDVIINTGKIGIKETFEIIKKALENKL